MANKNSVNLLNHSFYGKRSPRTIVEILDSSWTFLYR